MILKVIVRKKILGEYYLKRRERGKAECDDTGSHWW